MSSLLFQGRLVVLGLLLAGFESCRSPREDVLARVTVPNPESLVLYEKTLLWFDGNELKSLPLDGGSLQTLTTVAGAPLRYLRCAAAAARIHCFRIDGVGSLSLVSVSLEPPHQTLVRRVGLQEGHAIAADERWIYWQGIIPDEYGRLEHLVVFKTGVDSKLSEILWPELPDRVFALREHGPFLYVAAKGIYRVRKDTGAAEEIVAAPNGVWDLEMDATNLFWVEAGAGGKEDRVMRRALSASDSVVIADKLDSPIAIGVDGEQVYWVSGSPPFHVSTRPTTGGPVRRLQQRSVPRLLVDHHRIYWIEFDGSRGASLRRAETGTN